MMFGPSEQHAVVMAECSAYRAWWRETASVCTLVRPPWGGMARDRLSGSFHSSLLVPRAGSVRMTGLGCHVLDGVVVVCRTYGVSCL